MDGLATPPPKGAKPWGLLAYLAVTGQAHPRSELAELLFSEAADPLGALRWNLAALRRLLCRPDALKGDTIRLDLSDAVIDIWQLDVGHLPVFEPGVSGQLLAGLSFPDSPRFEMWLTGERVRTFQWGALGLAALGVGVIAAHADGTTTPLGLGLIVLSAASWAGGNIVARRAGQVDMLAYVVWGSLFSVPPLFVMSLIFDGWPAIVRGVETASVGTWAAVLYQSVANSLFGYAAWGWLLARHPAATVAPLSLLVPVFGMAASAALLAEPLPGWKLFAAALVMSGLALNLFWPMLQRRLAPA